MKRCEMINVGLLVLAIVHGPVSFAASPQVKNVKAFQQYPWGKVYVSYEVVGDIAANAGSGKTPFLFVMANDKTTGHLHGEVSSGESYLSGDLGTASGQHKIVWDVSAQGLTINSTNVVFTVVYCDELYQVIDLSSGSNSSSYPISYLYGVPSGGWTDTYKTTKLALRRISPGAFKMCGEYNVTLTKPFYIGVFEVTQKQYELVTGTTPSPHRGNTRPVEKVSYNMIRGASNGAQWPSSSMVDSTSFMGKLRARTGLAFDLPTEAQWEYACRAGTTSTYNNGGNTENDLKKLGRYGGNRPYGHEESGLETHAPVGSYQPNAWGLYDMHGNVWERCLDYHLGNLSNGGTDPKGSATGSTRVIRGGSWGTDAGGCASSSRQGSAPDSTGHNLEAYCYPGFRISMTLR